MSLKRQPVVNLLVILFGISAWIEVNGLWVELPFFVATLPEKGYIASYIVAITQLANIGPIMYGILRRFSHGKVKDKRLIHSTFVIGVVSCFLLCFSWRRTSFIGNSEHSTAFLTLVFFLAFVDCTSSVLYLPFMANLREIYLIPYLIGEGLSGLLPSLVALIQGVGGNPECITVNVTVPLCDPIGTNVSSFTECSNVTVKNETVSRYPSPRFSVEAFFIFLTIMLVISWCSFFLLNILPQAKSEWVSTNFQHTAQIANYFVTCDAEETRAHVSRTASGTSECLFGHRHLTRTNIHILLVLQGFLCCLSNGVLPSIQAFSCSPYGNVAFHLAVTLSSIANPLASFVSMYRWTENQCLLLLEVVLGTLCASYIMVTAVQSPFPPLVNTTIGEILIVLSWIMFHGLFAYVKACLACILCQQGGQKLLFQYGVATQVGSFMGAFVIFFIVNYTTTFTFFSCS